jgi:uncharacterized protein
MHISRHNLIFNTQEPDWFVVLNPLARSIDLLDSRAIEILQSPGASDAWNAFPEFLRLCLERGYVYHEADDEEQRLRALEKKSKELSDAEPLAFVVYVTFACNLRCTYCFESRSLQGQRGVIQPDVIDSLFRAIAELQQQRNNPMPPEITLFGGEPLLRGKAHEESITRILDSCKEKGFRISLITNGVELGGYSDLLSRYDIENIQITVDGPQRIHDRRRIFANGQGSFHRIVAGIDEALEKGLKISLRVNVDDENVAYLPELADFILQKGWLEKRVDVYITPVNENGPENKVCLQQSRIETLKTLLEMKQQHRQLDFMTISHWLVQYFENILERGTLPMPETRFCEATTGTQYSVDFMGRVFTCC